MEFTNFFVLLAGAVAMGGAGAAVAVPLSLTKQEVQSTPVVEERREEFKHTPANKKDWYCSWDGKWQCTPTFEVEVPIPASTVDDESE